MTYQRTCNQHFTDPFLREYISEHGSENVCDVCEEQKICIEIKDLANHIEEHLHYEYGEPYEEGAAYDKETGGFIGTTPDDTEEILGPELKVDDDYLFEEICSSINNFYWVKRDPYGPWEHEYLIGGWAKFKDVLKYRIRYLFFDKENKTVFEDRYRETMNPFYILDEVGNAVEELELIKVYPPHYLVLVRARQHAPIEKVKCAQDLGSPPPVYAKANRMSPAGISMFYGAFDENTCIAEVKDEKWEDSIITYGDFVNLEEFRLIDFTGLKQIPSLFDPEKRHLREVSKFLLAFIEELSIPVRPDDSVHIEYVPTQVVTEYFKLSKKLNVDGLIYNSVKNSGKKCVVLFVGYGKIDNSDLILNDSPNTKGTSKSAVLQLKNDTVKSINL